MKTAIAGFCLVLVCLFVLSLTWGNKVISKWDLSPIYEGRVTKKAAPTQVIREQKEIRKNKLRMSMNPFDLTGGLTFQELDNMRHDSGYRYFAFLYLVGALWMVWGLRMSRDRR
jgi:hypothetical protein